jgi:surface antigen
MTKFLGSAVFTLLFLVVLPAHLAQAQVNPFKNTAIEKLTDQDIEIVKESAASLYQVDDPVIGDAAAWSNTDSGNFGTIELVDVYDWRKMPCRKLQHLMQIKGWKDTVRMTVDRCKVSSGEWKIRY